MPKLPWSLIGILTLLQLRVGIPIRLQGSFGMCISSKIIGNQPVDFFGFREF